jgi:HAE1 family hydrophobic/amphiphilic exporter-1
MILALGILVDTAIVVVEGIEYYLHKGYKPQEAAVRSLHEFKQPLISGALTTLAVFIPLFTLPGVLGQYLAFIPITVFIVITASLFISLLLITSLGAMIMRPQKIKKNGFSFRRKFNKIQSAIVNFYGFLLRGFISSRVMRLGALILITALSLGSCALPIPYVQFPTDDANAFQISIKTPVGTAPEQVALLTQEIEERVIKLPETENIFTTINNNTASLYIELIIKEQRQDLGLRQSTKLVSLLQKEYQNFSRADIRVENPQGGPPSETPVGFRVVAQKKQNIPQAQEVAIELTEELKQIEGTQGVRNNIEIIPGDFVYRINRRKAINLGLNPDQLDGVIRTAVKGTTATTISRDNRDIDVTVRYRPEAIAEINDIYGIRVTNNQGRQIRLEQVIEKELTDSLSTVRRIDGKIAFTVSSFLTDDGNALEISEEFKQIIIDKYDLPEDSTTFNLPNNVSIEDAGENAEGQEVNNALLNGFVIAVLLMTLVLVIQFNSFLQPLLILATILFAQLGVNLGLYLTDTVKSLAYMIGTISLAGIVVNDSIIIVDQMNKTVGKDNRKSVIDSIVYAGKSRFIPVILTTLTTSAGILPLVWTDAFWRSLSITVIGGLTLASLLTLFLTPALFIQLRQEKLLTFSMFTIIGLIGFLLYRIINLMFLNPAINNVALVVVQLVALAVILAIFIGLFIWSLKKARQKDQLLYEPVSS